MRVVKRSGALTILFLLFFFILNSSKVIAESVAIIKAIEVKGNRQVSRNTILSALVSKVGEEYSPALLLKDLKAIYSLGFFQDVQIDVEEYEGGVKLTYLVVERPLVKEIKIEGNKALKDSDIKEVITIATDKIYDQKLVAESEGKIIARYQEKGYPYVQVRTETIMDRAQGKATVVFHISEGDKMLIKEINIFGNKAFSEKQIRKQMETKEAGVISSGILKEETLRKDIEKIISFYKDRGYAQVDILKPEIIYDQEKKRIIINITVKEGPQFRIGQIEIKGNTLFSLETIQKEMQTKEGSIYSKKKYDQDLAAIRNLYYEKGYISAYITTQTSFDEEKGKIDIKMNITEGGIVHIDKVKVKNYIITEVEASDLKAGMELAKNVYYASTNILLEKGTRLTKQDIEKIKAWNITKVEIIERGKTKEKIIKRELTFKEGDIFEVGKLRRSLQKLNNLGYFEEVNLDTEPSDASDKLDVLIDVKEGRTGTLSFGAGYSSVDKLVGLVELAKNNFAFAFPHFTGGGKRVSLRYEFGATKQNIDLSYTEPWLLDKPIIFGLDAFNLTRERDYYNEKQVGGALRFGFTLTEFTKLHFKYRYEDLNIFNVDEVNAPFEILQQKGRSRTSGLTPSIVRDSRDNIFDASSGSYNSLFLEYAGGFLGGTNNFTKYQVESSWFFKSWWKFVLGLRVRLGYVDSFSPSITVPLPDRFYTGGAYTVRGYEERGIGPKDPATGTPLGGKTMLVLNTEYKFPITKELKGTFFVDGGNVWSEFKDIDYPNLRLKYGVGAGIRVILPIGAIRLDYGYGLNEEPGKPKGKVHFSLGQIF